MRVLSGMRPTGKLHLGHLVGALSQWLKLQEEHTCFFMVADWHALMSEYKNPHLIQEYALDNVKDWLSCGIHPQKSCIFIQSQVREHLELFMILSCLTPLGWLYRCPTYKDQIQQLKDKELSNYGFLGYPVLQTADIIIYKAEGVPVGEDQLPHLELAREIIRRFHFLYKKEIFPEPQAILSSFPRLLGLDSRKMSKSFNNIISLQEEPEVVKKKVMSMFTDPLRIRRTDPGHPLKCNVYSYYKAFKPSMIEEVKDWCENAKQGCTDCKRRLAQIIIEVLAPIQEKRRQLDKKSDYVFDIIKEGNKKAKNVASKTLEEVRELLKL